jgi:hypothetical protein
MPKFTIFNPATKMIVGEFEFNDFRDAEKFTNENYPGYMSKYQPFHFEIDFNSMLVDNGHPDVLYNDRKRIICIKVEKRNQIITAGQMTMNELEQVRQIRCKVKFVSNLEFIRINNFIQRKYKTL